MVYDPEDNVSSDETTDNPPRAIYNIWPKNIYNFLYWLTEMGGILQCK